MTSTPACPTEQALRRFLLGQDTPEEAASLESHLGACDRCLATPPLLHADDLLVESMRRRSHAAERPAPEGDRILADWLKTLRPGSVPGVRPTPAVPPEATVTADPVPPNQAGDGTTGVYDFLTPGRGPHESGSLGPYEVGEVLGSGGMGVVFRAYDPDLRRWVALKTTLPALANHPTAKQRFLREARAAAAIKHDHIVTIYHVGEDRGIAYLAMELLEGESLDRRLQREGRLPVGELLRVARECAQGLAAAHEHGLIHRDVKPGNIWLETGRGSGPAGHSPASDSRVKILDFGLAIPTSDDANLTQTGAIVGTPAFMAPEQFRDRTVDARSDLFSLGCVLYRMATGEVPFQGRYAISTLITMATTNPRPPRELNPDLPQALCDLIACLLAKEPADRPASAAALIGLIRAIERGSARPATPPRRYRRPPALAAAGVGLACVFGLLCSWTWSALRPAGPSDAGPAARTTDESPNAISGVGKRATRFFADPARGLEGILDHREIAGADADAFRRWRASLGHDFRLAHLSTRQGTGPTLFNAVAVREKTPRLVRFRADVPDDVGQKNFDLLTEDGFRPASLTLRPLHDPKARWAESQIWLKDQIGYGVRGGTFADLLARIKEHKGQGLRPIGLDAVPTPDGVRFASNFVEVRDRPWEVELSLTADELLETVGSYKDRGWRPDVLTPYWDGGRLRFMLVAVGNDDGPDWRFRTEASLAQFEKESAGQRAGGLFPLAIASYGHGSDVRYAATWVRHRAPGTEPPPPEVPDAAAVADRSAHAVSWAAPASKGLYEDKARALEGVVDFREVVGNTSKELRGWQEKLDPEYRISLVTSRRGDGPPLFNAVAVREVKQTASRFYLEIPEASGQQVWDKNREDGFRIAACCANLDENHRSPGNSTQVWVKDGVGQWFWHDKMPNITGGNRQGKSEGGRPIDMDAKPSPTGLQCSTTLGGDQGRAWEVFYTLTPEELLTTVEFYRRKGWRPDVLVPYQEEGQQRNILVVVDNHDEVDWRFRMDMDPVEYRKESARQKHDGLFPLGLASYGKDADIRYAAIFVRYRHPRKE